MRDRAVAPSRLSLEASYAPDRSSPHKLSHRPTNSIASTDASPSENADMGAEPTTPTPPEPMPATVPMPAPEGTATAPAMGVEAWSSRWTRKMPYGKGDESQFVDRVPILDPSLDSVSAAVSLLNAGTLQCPKGFCAVFSKSEQAYFFVHRLGVYAASMVPVQRSTSKEAKVQGITATSRSPTSRPAQMAWMTGPENASSPSSPPGTSPLSATSPSRVTSKGNTGARSARFGMPAEAAAEAKPAQTKKSGGEAVIGGRPFILQEVIGRGAFGVVWRAAERDGGSSNRGVAVKVMELKTTQALSSAKFEADVLRLLSSVTPSLPAERVPSYIGHEVTFNRNDTCTMHLAMSLVPGSMLDEWLYGVTCEAQMRVDIAQLIEGKLPGNRQRSMSLTQACAFAENLVIQLAEVLGKLQPIAYHRDISAHNVLADVADGDIGETATRFAVIDFGLAVHSVTWRQTCRSSNLSGDPRYWTIPAWLALTYGFKSIDQNRSYMRQYVERLDHHSTGILGFEVLFALLDPMRQEVTPCLAEARAAWNRYWARMYQLFQDFHLLGTAELRRRLIALNSGPGSIQHTAQLLTHFRRAVRAAAAHPDNAKFAPLLSLLADLIDEEGRAQWLDVPAKLKGGSPLSPRSRGATIAEGKAAAPVVSSTAQKINQRSLEMIPVHVESVSGNRQKSPISGVSSAGGVIIGTTTNVADLSRTVGSITRMQSAATVRSARGSASLLPKPVDAPARDSLPTWSVQRCPPSAFAPAGRSAGTPSLSPSPASVALTATAKAPSLTGTWRSMPLRSQAVGVTTTSSRSNSPRRRLVSTVSGGVARV